MDTLSSAINCPKCGTAARASADECPQCGILFSKWQQREDNVATGNTARYAALARATSSEFNWTILVIVAVAIGTVFMFLYQGAM